MRLKLTGVVVTQRDVVTLKRITRKSTIHYWTESELRTLIDAYNSGEKPAAIATILKGRSATSISAKISQILRDQRTLDNSQK